jgi:hypothetical protein
MINALILIAVGAFIGWNIPQPTYAKKIQEWILSKITWIKGFFTK